MTSIGDVSLCVVATMYTFCLLMLKNLIPSAAFIQYRKRCVLNNVYWYTIRDRFQSILCVYKWKVCLTVLTKWGINGLVLSLSLRRNTSTLFASSSAGFRSF